MLALLTTVMFNPPMLSWLGATRGRSRILWGALVLLVTSPPVRAEPGNTVKPKSDQAENHALLCKCGPRCRAESCCCGRTKPPRVEKHDSVSWPVEHFDAGDADRSCLSAAPCGDPLVPAPSTFGPSVKSLFISQSAQRPPVREQKRVSTSLSPLRSITRISRIDRPPKLLSAS